MNALKTTCPLPASGTSMAELIQALGLLAGGVADIELPRTRASAGQWIVAAGAAMAIVGVVLAIGGAAEVLLGDDL